MTKGFRKCTHLMLILALLFTQIFVFLPSQNAYAADTVNLAQGKAITANNYTQNYVATNANDGNVNTYWEGAANQYPNTLTIDLGSAQSVYKVVLKLNPDTAWSTRTQTLSVLTGTDNTNYTTNVASNTYTFNPSGANTVTITFTETSARYVRINFTGNSGATGGQVAEFEVYGTATTGTPDYVVTDISWSPANPNVGSAVTFSATIKNQGTGATPAGVINGVSFMVDGTQVCWSDNNTSSIAAGDSITVTANGGPSGAAWTATSGTHTITAWVDDVNRVAESNESNNQYSKTLTPGSVSLPDLIITDITYSPTSPAVGNTVTFSAVVKNQGTAAGAAGTVTFQVDGTQAATVTDTSSIAAGATLTVTGIGSWTATSGTHTLSAAVDTANATAESNESNNSYSENLTINPSGTPDLIVTDITYTPASPAAGNAVTFSAAVKNQGTAAGAAGTVTFTVDGSLVSTVTNNTPIAAGATSTITADRTWAAANGTHTITVSADTTNATTESDESNNSLSKVLTIGSAGTNQSKGKPITASSSVFTFVATNANDGLAATYWEGNSGSYPNTLTVNFGANINTSQVVLKLNPDAAWSTRTQTIQVLGHDQNSSTFTNLVSAAVYTFNPSTGNTVTIPLTATVSELQLRITTNSGAPAGQIAEFEVYGTQAPNPDLTITGITWSPTSPIETDNITLTANVKNNGTADAAASNVRFYLGNTLVGTANTPVIPIGATSNVSVTLSGQDAGSYTVTAKADEADTLVELDNSNNNYTATGSLVVNQVPSSDLIGNVSWTPGNPSGGNTVTFTVNLKNQGNIASGGGAHGITLVLKNSSGATVQTYNGSYTGSLGVGDSTNVTMGTWTAVNGSYSLTCTIATDTNEVPIKQANNVSTTSLYSGRGANMPFTVIEAESSAVSTNGTRLEPNYKLADFAGEASGRSSVYLDANGEYVEFTLTAPANAFVLRNAVAENTTGTISVYANGVDKGNFTVTSKFSYVYATPTTLDRLGYDNSGSTAYWLYEDSQLMLDQVYPAGTKIRIQKDSGDVSWIYIDLLETENVAPAATNPDPTKYIEVSATKSIEQALTDFRQDSTKLGIFIPAGTWTINNKITVYGRATQIIGAGPWWTKLTAPQGQSNTDVGFAISSSANGSTIKDLSAWGNYIYRQDGPGKFIDGNGMQNVTIDNIWIEHFVCMYWGVNSSYNTFKNCRIKNTFADGINMTNGSSYNTITNCYARACGDDSFALFSAIDAGGSYNVGNQFTNLTAVCVRRAACFAVYGGSNNLYQNLYGADTLNYPGITISSLSFGYNTLGFGDTDCVFDGITLDRCGGDFYTSNGADDKINGYQNFGAIWLFCGDRPFRNILVKNVDINNPVYYGIMFQTKYPEALSMQNVRLENININNPTRYGIKLVVLAESGQGPVVGGASFTNVKINNPGIMPIYGQSGCPNFTITKIGNGNNW